ncbi:hypothetical protein DFH29DRAFT_540297 [Suillus ampliporus]|nr:hypothetical protein DFH29DRAFT_540297 [Suillus ampliporus]
MCSLKKLASLWRSDFHLNTVFEEAVVGSDYEQLRGSSKGQFVKCGLWCWDELHNFFIRDCSTNTNLSRTWPLHSLHSQHLFEHHVNADPLQDVVVIVSAPRVIIVTDGGQDQAVFWVGIRLASSLGPHPDCVCDTVECKHTFGAPGSYRVSFLDRPVICGDRIIVFYYIEVTDDTPMSTTFIHVVDWRRGYAKSVSSCTLENSATYISQTASSMSTSSPRGHGTFSCS